VDRGGACEGGSQNSLGGHERRGRTGTRIAVARSPVILRHESPLHSRELYDLVWSEPMPKLAPRFGVSDADLADTSREAIIQRPLPLGGPRAKSTAPDAADSRGIGLLFLLPFCSHNTPKQGGTRRRTTHHQTTWHRLLPNAFPARSEGYRSRPSCTHNPKVAGSNPAPATTQGQGVSGQRR